MLARLSRLGWVYESGKILLGVWTSFLRLPVSIVVQLAFPAKIIRCLGVIVNNVVGLSLTKIHTVVSNSEVSCSLEY